MNVDLGIWDKLSKVVLVLLLVAVAVAVGFLYLPLIKTNENMRKEILRLEAEVKKQEDLARELHASLEQLRTDPKTVERMAREKLGYAKPGETVIRFETSAENAAASR